MGHGTDVMTSMGTGFDHRYWLTVVLGIVRGHEVQGAAEDFKRTGVISSSGDWLYKTV